jgi:dephospho-CoA kinase
MATPLPRIRVFGLTGGLASGKSTVAARFAARGLPVIDADALAREVVGPGSPGLAEIVARFGAEVTRDAVLDRKRLAEVVFSSPDELARLEAIIHPRVQALRDARVAELQARGEPLACYEVPLLYEKGLDHALRPIIAVSVPESVQIARARLRDSSTEAQVRARLSAQLPLGEKARRADYVIDNGGSLESTVRAADAVLDGVCAQLGVDPARYRPFTGNSPGAAAVR